MDIVERLRTEETDLFRLQETAADEIEALRRELAEWKNACEQKTEIMQSHSDERQELQRQVLALTQERDKLQKYSAELFAEHDEVKTELVESQAREQQLREALKFYMKPPISQLNDHLVAASRLGVAALALPQDDTALRQYGVKLLLDAAENIGYPMSAIELRRMAEEMTR